MKFPTVASKQAVNSDDLPFGGGAPAIVATDGAAVEGIGAEGAAVEGAAVDTDGKLAGTESHDDFARQSTASFRLGVSLETQLPVQCSVCLPLSKK